MQNRPFCIRIRQIPNAPSIPCHRAGPVSSKSAQNVYALPRKWTRSRARRQYLNKIAIFVV